MKNETKQKIEDNEDALSFPYEGKSVPICKTHTKDRWRYHFGYINNHDGTISCKWCGWGTSLPGYMRLVDGKLIDLREVNRDESYF